ncbi:MAG: tetratricopeptide repeat protein [Chloroflexota bacterium]
MPLDFDGDLQFFAGANDPAVMRLIYSMGMAINVRERQPRQSLSALKQTAERANALGEYCIALVAEAFMVEIHMNYLNATNTALDTAVRLSVRASEDRFDDCPRARAMAYNYLAFVYAYVDPVGYADDIRGSLGFMLEHGNPTDIARQEIYARLSMMEAMCERYDEAETLALQSLELAEDDIGSLCRSYTALTGTYARQHQHHQALEYAQLGRELLQSQNHQLGIFLAQFMGYEAAMLAHLGETHEANIAFNNLRAHIIRLAIPPPYTVPGFMGDYFIGLGDYNKALGCYKDMLAQVIASGSPYAEAEARMLVCFATSRLGGDMTEAASAARAVFERLRAPDQLAVKLEQIERGELERYP